MIEINLLPDIYRPSPGASLPRIVLMLCGGLGALVLFFLILVVWNQNKDMAGDIRAIKKTIAGLDKVILKVRDMEMDIERERGKHKSMLKLLQSRRLWTPLLDRLASNSILPPGVWMRRLDFQPPRGKDIQDPGGISLECYARAMTSNPGDVIRRKEMGEALYTFINNMADPRPPEGGNGGRVPFYLSDYLADAQIRERNYRKLAQMDNTPQGQEVLQFRAFVPFLSLVKAGKEGE